MVQRRMDEGARRGLRCCCADVCYRSPSEESCRREYGSCGASMSVLQRLCTCCYVYLRASITQPVSQMLFWQRNRLWESSEVDKQLLHLPRVSGAQNIMRQRTGQRDCSAASLFWARGNKNGLLVNLQPRKVVWGVKMELGCKVAVVPPCLH